MARLDNGPSLPHDEKELSNVDEIEEGVRMRKRAKVREGRCKAEDVPDVNVESGSLSGIVHSRTEPSGSVVAGTPIGSTAAEQLSGSAGTGESIRSEAAEQLSKSAGIEQRSGRLATEHPGNGNETVQETDAVTPREKGDSQAQPKGNAEGQPENIGRSIRDTFPKRTIFTKLTADVAEDRGSRHTMEDAWLILPQGWLGDAGELRLAHFAIYDGHGGRNAAEYARGHLHASVLSAGFPRESVDVKKAKRAITEGFKNTDDALLRESSTGGWQDGATAVSVWVLGQTVLIANLGDAKAVLARAPAGDQGESLSGEDAASVKSKRESLKGLIVTKEHKAIFPSERARIEKAGGYVEGNGRLLGRLEVSRAFGDRNFKKAGVIAVPDIQKFELTERERFLILGCDGLWGVFGPSDAVEFVAEQLKNNVSLGMACRRLIREAVRERKCKDNCTAIVINFEHSDQ